MLEWLKRHAWKACIRQKRIRGSNPRLSARQEKGFKAGKAESLYGIPRLSARQEKGFKAGKAESLYGIPVSPLTYIEDIK